MLTRSQPTVAVNGVKDYDATSMWTEEKWLDWFEWVPLQPVFGTRLNASSDATQAPGRSSQGQCRASDSARVSSHSMDPSSFGMKVAMGRHYLHVVPMHTASL